MGDVVVRHSFTPALLNPPVLAAGVASLGSLHREWGLRIAQELALTFGREWGLRVAQEQALIFGRSVVLLCTWGAIECV
eukprot:1161277-Pelagomonas_calceolata.AAC.11